jgi:hypothetical protein
LEEYFVIVAIKEKYIAVIKTQILFFTYYNRVLYGSVKGSWDYFYGVIITNIHIIYIRKYELNNLPVPPAPLP